MPLVLNLHVRKWQAYKCKLPNFIEVPTQGGIGLDHLNLAVAIVGAVCLGENFGTEQSIFTYNKDIPIEYTYSTLVAIFASFISGCLLGYGLAEIRILCSFKNVREKLYKQNYNYLKPLFYTLLAG